MFRAHCGIIETGGNRPAFADLAFLVPWKLFFNNAGWVKRISDPWRPNTFKLYVRLTPQAE